MSTNLWTKVNTLSFKTKSILLAISLGTVPAISIGVINYFQINNASQQQAVKTQKARVASIADKLNRFIFERNGDVSVMSSLPIFATAKVAAITSVTKTLC
jgi:methyl-accepting chemotaxis protein PixJ